MPLLHKYYHGNWRRKTIVHKNTVGSEDSEQVRCLDDHITIRWDWGNLLPAERQVFLLAFLQAYIQTQREKQPPPPYLPASLCVPNSVLAYSPYSKCLSSFPEVHVKEEKQSYRTASKKARILKPLMMIQAQWALIWRKTDTKTNKQKKPENKRPPLLCNNSSLKIDW